MKIKSLSLLMAVFISLMFISCPHSSKYIGDVYYVSVEGDDSGPGSFDHPWGSWQKAFSTAESGDTVYFRGGVWYPQDHSRGNTVVEINTKDNIGHSGTKENPIRFFNYPGETPILDCSQVDMTGNKFNGAIGLSYTSYIHLKGLTVRYVVQPESKELASGIGTSMSHNMTFENLTVHDIGGRGMSYWGVSGHPDLPDFPTDITKFINCDIYNCFDSLSEVPGNGADGIKMDAESDTFLYFYGCRAWNCSDDGFDISGPGLTVYDTCWSFNQGFPGACDGNGFKLGGNRGVGAVQDSTGNTTLGPIVTGVRKIIKNSVAAGNSGCGIYDLAYAPYYPNDTRVYNNTIYNNGIGISIAINDEYENISPPQYYNNINYKPKQNNAAGRPYLISVTNTYITVNNTFRFAPKSEVGSLPWVMPNEKFNVTDADFVSLNIEELKAPRKPDGSLPDVNFMKLASGSKLIDAGVDLENYIASDLRTAGIESLPFKGKFPDLGYAERD
ncbi:MAG TPA: hypothetical protein VJ861_09335 [Treponemataceae bacterium]|nr:hypothetical protein [Treponemataceae bacterium]